MRSSSLLSAQPVMPVRIRGPPCDGRRHQGAECRQYTRDLWPALAGPEHRDIRRRCTTVGQDALDVRGVRVEEPTIEIQAGAAGQLLVAIPEADQLGLGQLFEVEQGVVRAR